METGGRATGGATVVWWSYSSYHYVLSPEVKIAVMICCLMKFVFFIKKEGQIK